MQSPDRLIRRTVPSDVGTKKKANSKRLVVLAFFLGLGILLYLIEFLFLPQLPFPGAKLGLANLVTLLLLALYTWRECMFNAIARTILGALLIGTFFTPAFLFSITGAIIATLTMIFVYNKYYGKFSFVGISLAGAVAHNLAQLVLASIFIAHWGIFLKTPFILAVAIPTGIFNGVLANKFLKRLANLPLEVKEKVQLEVLR